MAEHAHSTTPKSVVISRRITVATALLSLSGATAAQGAEPESPDAALISLCAEVGVHRDRFNHESLLDSDDCPIWAAYVQAADAISEAEPQTMAGLVAKAHAAKLEAAIPDGLFDPAGTMASRWAWDLVNDLIRLGGQA